MGLSCKEEGDSGFGIMDGIHATLDAAGLVPAVGIIPDALNAVIYLVEGDMVNAGFAGAAMIPIAGQAATATKYGAKAVDAISSTAVKAKKAIKVLPKRKTPSDFSQFKSMNHKKAAAGEFNAHELMKEKGFKPLGKTDGKYKPGETGIDGIYKHPNPPPDFVITEAKFNTARLGKTKDGKQMGNKWVNEERLRKAGMDEDQIDDIIDALKDNDGSVEKLLIRNKSDGSLVVKSLDKNAKIIGKALGF